jgi:hypothetical protein
VKGKGINILEAAGDDVIRVLYERLHEYVITMYSAA